MTEPLAARVHQARLLKAARKLLPTGNLKTKSYLSSTLMSLKNGISSREWSCVIEQGILVSQVHQ
jgi:hypothetical protein